MEPWWSTSSDPLDPFSLLILLGPCSFVLCPFWSSCPCALWLRLAWYLTHVSPLCFLHFQQCSALGLFDELHWVHNHILNSRLMFPGSSSMFQVWCCFRQTITRFTLWIPFLPSALKDKVLSLGNLRNVRGHASICRWSEEGLAIAFRRAGAEEAAAVACCVWVPTLALCCLSAAAVEASAKGAAACGVCVAGLMDKSRAASDRDRQASVNFWISGERCRSLKVGGVRPSQAFRELRIS